MNNTQYKDISLTGLLQKLRNISDLPPAELKMIKSIDIKKLAKKI